MALSSNTYTGSLALAGAHDAYNNSPNVPNPVDPRTFNGEAEPGTYPTVAVAPVNQGSEFGGTDFEDVVTNTPGNDRFELDHDPNFPRVYQVYPDQLSNQTAVWNVAGNSQDARKVNRSKTEFLDPNEKYPNADVPSNPANTQNPAVYTRGFNSLAESTPYRDSQQPSVRATNIFQDIKRETNESRTYTATPLYVNNAIAASARGSDAPGSIGFGPYFPSAQRFQTKQQMVPQVFRDPTGNQDLYTAQSTDGYSNEIVVEVGGF